MVIKKIETALSSFEIFLLFEKRRNCVFFDSAMTHEALGRFSIVAFDPEITFLAKNGAVSIRGRENADIEPADPFDALDALLERYRMDYDGPLPFIGGAAGYFSYDMRHYLEKLSRGAVDDVGLPDCFFGIYDGSIIIDHEKGEVWVAAAGIFNDPEAWAAAVTAAVASGSCCGRTPHGLPQESAGDRTEDGCASAGISGRLYANIGKEEYIEAIGSIRDHIKAGDIYQVNMTVRFEGDCSQAPIELYRRLRSINPAPFACYLDFDAGHVICSSPERFVRIRNGRAQTRPIKGTRPRGATAEEDLRYREELVGSEKDRAELLMIVDLERNDLGRVCKAGSVRVTELFALEEYASVYHLVATVEGELEDGIDAVGCLKAMFPGGSITGAPKIRAMEIIDKLEPTARGIYTGSTGYIGFNGHSDFNIAIRTIVLKDGRAYFQAGGGIVWDSEAESEYDELRCKADALMRAARLKP